MTTTTARRLGATAAFVATTMLAAACSGGTPVASGAATADAVAPAAGTVTVTDNHGSIEVPVAPERVVALDNTTFQTLSDWGVELVAAPKPLMGDLWPTLAGGDDVLDVGSHREPNLESVIAAEPDLIVGGYRFASQYEELKKIQPAIIETNPREGEDQMSELKRQVGILGQVFDREDDATALADGLDKSIADAKAAYNGTDSVIGLITSGGSISFAAPGSGRGVGALFPALGLTPAIETAAEDSSHGDDIGVEAIAASNPEWIIVLDRDASLDTEGYVAAKELIAGSEALKNVPAVQKNQIVYLSPGFYLDEGIQSYTKLFNDVAAAFSAAS